MSIDKYYFCEHNNKPPPEFPHDSTLEDLRDSRNINEYYNKSVWSSSCETNFDCLKAILITGKKKYLVLKKHTRMKALKRINKALFLRDKINLDDPFWRNWFFVENEKYLYQYCNLNQFIKNKKKELMLIQNELKQNIKNILCDDIINCIIFKYI